MSKIALITGATSGIGEACALIFAENGYDLILTGRREDRLLLLAKNLKNKFSIKCLPLNFDVRDKEAVKKQLDNLPKDWQKIDVLLNNAGLASGLDKIQDGNSEDWDRMIDTNVKGLLYVSESIIPYLIENKKGHIINIGSTAGKELYEKGNVYCASKHAVNAISKGMRIDLLEYGIKVTQICPGAAETEFSLVRFHGNKEKAKNVYQGYQPMSAKDIAEVVYYTTTVPAHLCINDIVLTSLAQANSIYFNKK